MSDWCHGTCAASKAQRLQPLVAKWFESSEMASRHDKIMTSSRPKHDYFAVDLSSENLWVPSFPKHSTLHPAKFPGTLGTHSRKRLRLAWLFGGPLGTVPGEVKPWWLHGWKKSVGHQWTWQMLVLVFLCLCWWLDMGDMVLFSWWQLEHSPPVPRESAQESCFPTPDPWEGLMLADVRWGGLQ